MRWSEDRVLKQLTKLTYKLETGEEDDQMRGFKNNWPSSRTLWKQVKRMIRWEVLKQLTKVTYFLETGEEDDQTRSRKTINQVHVRPGDVWSDEKS